jgi:hypothetical protein
VHILVAKSNFLARWIPKLFCPQYLKYLPSLWLPALNSMFCFLIVRHRSLQVNRSLYFRRKISASKIKRCTVSRKKMTPVMHKLNRESDLHDSRQGCKSGHVRMLCWVWIFPIKIQNSFLLITNLTHFFNVFIYFTSLHVSSNAVLIIRRINCIDTSSGMY